MPENINQKIRQTPLQQAGVETRKHVTETLKLQEISDLFLIRLHSLPTAGSSELDLPVETGQCSGDDPVALCLRPRDWLLISGETSAEMLLSQFRNVINENQTAVVDQSDGLGVFRLSGPGAPWLLSKLSGLDFLAGKNHGEHCARTKMGHIAVIVHYHQRAGDDFVFDLVFDRSVARYFWLLLTESSAHADELTKTFGDHY